ncbi:capsule biosynthesis protein [Falsirhodobacter sp. 20TX0035]|uniref:capsule biosynthesis protein n=1 Tax=Falsirhodobacter sp. 20TX0035 TaxID=3022019 RepID=UPI00232B5EFF|nr:capsular biosynthesis protein [Falsirhodobacter sp. 20TX0035]MDB6453659.1 capsular biosynthesis protein [Falsirhodobacter sp. 20TX0035]
MAHSDRVFLFLQGPHGPWFRTLGKGIAASGAKVCRVAFNAGDRAFWPADTLIPFNGAPEDWPATFTALIKARGVTDIVLYGDTRPIHARAVEIAKARGIIVHVFEEGYLRPHWVTYERGGSNGHSRLMDTTVAQMREALERVDMDLPEAPARWGDMRQHVFWGAVYHFFVATGRGFENFRPHRDLNVHQEFRLYLRRLALMPVHHVKRRLATRRIMRGGFPYHLVLMQLAHDSSFRMHSPFGSITEFLELVTSAFAVGAPPHHHLVFKAHPLEDGRTPVAEEVCRLARLHGIEARVHFVQGGKLARLMNDARSAVTVNSTAGQQVLWRGLPLAALGRAVYGKPEFITDQPLARFFAAPARPDGRAYRDYRHYLLETSQVPGGFYSAQGRHALLRQVVDMMLQDEDPYDALQCGKSAPKQPLRAVH